MVFALLTIWVLDQLITLVWDRFAEPHARAGDVDRGLVARGRRSRGALPQPQVSRISHEVVGELAKVSWPSREGDAVSTIVVIVTSLIAA